MDETTPLLRGDKNKGISSNNYSNDTSHFSSFPSQGVPRTKYKFSGKNNFTDESNSIWMNGSNDARMPDHLAIFNKYEKEIRIEQRLINKVWEDQDLSELILNLYKYKQFFWKNKSAEYQKFDDFKTNKTNLYPQHMPVGHTEKDMFANINNLENERNKYRLRVEQLEK